MSTVIGKTSDNIEDLLDELVETGAISDSGELTLTTRGGSVISLGTIPSPTSTLSAWPVGSIFMGVSATNPTTLLGGGTWVAWGTGRVPVGVDTGQTEFDTVEETGGEKTHTLTTGEIPAHTHAIDHNHAAATSSGQSASHTHNSAIRYSGDGPTTGAAETVRDIGGITGGGGSSAFASSGNASVDHTHQVDLPNFTGSSGSAGVGGPHNNLQPYITCYMWKRTA